MVVATRKNAVKLLFPVTPEFGKAVPGTLQDAIENRAGLVGVAVMVQGPVSSCEKTVGEYKVTFTACPMDAEVTLNLRNGRRHTLKVVNA